VLDDDRELGHLGRLADRDRRLEDAAVPALHDHTDDDTAIGRGPSRRR
jgi:hypothetical protein